MSRDRPSCAASPSPPDLTLFPEDELVSLDELQEKVAEFEDYVQSTDVAAMQSKRLALRVHGRSLIRFASRRAVRSVYYVRRRVSVSASGFRAVRIYIVVLSDPRPRPSECVHPASRCSHNSTIACDLNPVRACRAAMSPHCAYIDNLTCPECGRREETCRVSYSGAGTTTTQAAGCHRLERAGQGIFDLKLQYDTGMCPMHRRMYEHLAVPLFARRWRWGHLRWSRCGRSVVAGPVMRSGASPPVTSSCS